MSKNGIQIIQHRLSTAGLDSQLSIAQEGRIETKEAIQRLESYLKALSFKYLREARSWGISFPLGTIPHRLEIADSAWVYGSSCIAATLLECGIAAYSFNYYLGFWVVSGILFTLPTVILMEGLLLSSISKPGASPQQALIRNYRILLVSISVFLVSAAVSFLVRFNFFLPSIIQNIALWLFSLSLLPAAAALFTHWFLLSWSVRREKEYRKVEEERTAMMVADHTFQTVIDEHCTPTDSLPSSCGDGRMSVEYSPISQPVITIEPLPIEAEVATVSPTRHIHRNGSNAGFATPKAIVMLFLLLLVLFLAGCESVKDKPLPNPSSPVLETSLSGNLLRFIVDVSLTTNPQAAPAYLEDKQKEIAKFVENNEIAQIEVLTVCSDATNANRIKVIDFPIKPQKYPMPDLSKFSEFENVRRAQEEIERQKIEADYQAALNTYRSTVEERTKVLNGKLFENVKRGTEVTIQTPGERALQPGW